MAQTGLGAGTNLGVASGIKTTSAEAAHLPSKSEGPTHPVVRLREVESARGLLINRRPLAESGTMGLGDVLQFGPPKSVGPTALLLHNDLRLDAW